MLIFTMLAVANAGYGDAVDGYPSWEERSMHLWTNAVRVDPEAFSSDYQAGGCSFGSFKSSEKTPKRTLMWHDGLNEAARYHSQDMQSNNWFDHDSSDGTSFFNRVARFYPSGYVGENIAWGYGNTYVVVTQGWMCSSGHRSNIMLADYDELGTGVVGSYYTQDFGYRGVSRQAIAMGFHEPRNPSGSATFWADYDGTPPDQVLVHLNDTVVEMDLEYGTAGQGVYVADASVSGCTLYWFEATVGGTSHRFPETGSYGFGSCDFDDDDAQWAALQMDSGGGGGDDTGTDGDTDTDGGGGDDGAGGDGGGDGSGGDGDGLSSSDSDLKLSGCAVPVGVVGWWPLLAVLGLRRRRS